MIGQRDIVAMGFLPLKFIDENMGQRTARWLAWSLVVLYFVLATIGHTFMILLPNIAPIGYGFPTAISLSLAAAIASLAGAIISSRLPWNPIGWIFALLAIIWGIELLSEGYIYYGLDVYPGSLPGPEIALIWRSSEASRFAIVGLTLLFLWFPSGRPVSSRWGKVAWIVVGATSANILLATLKPGPVKDFPFLVNPIGMGEAAWAILNPIMATARVIMTLCVVAAAISLLIRFRRAGGDERQQLKWFSYATAFFPFAVVFLSYGGPEFRTAGLALQFLSLTGLSIAVAIAISKYRLYDIDIIINRTLVYGLLTAMLALAYYVSVVLLQQILRALTDQESPLAIVGSTLIIVALFAPLRRRVQDFIDRRFYRSKYDAEKTLARFAASARDEVDLDELTAELLRVVQETMQPTHVSLWIREPERHPDIN